MALGGVENGLARLYCHITATPISRDKGLTPIETDACIAMGAKATAVAVLLINI